MTVAAEVIVGILIAALLVATALALFVGLMGALFSEGFQKCQRCGHWTLGFQGTTHLHGCPGSFYEHGAHILQVAFHHAHVRQH